mgnify:CR=1 FL=1
MPTLAIFTNARAADQRSMIGYGEMLLEAARHLTQRDSRNVNAQPQQ